MVDFTPGSPTLPQVQAIAFVNNMLVPHGTPRVLSRSYNFTAGGSYTEDFTNLVQQGKMEFVQSAYIDNSANGFEFGIYCTHTNQTIIIPGGYQGFLPIVEANPPIFLVATNGTATVTVLWFNFPIPAAVWPAVNAATNQTNTSSGVAPIGTGVTTEADTSIILLPANPLRTYMMIGAPQSAGIWINFSGGAAGPDLPGSFFVPQGGIYESGARCSTAQINIYCGTDDLVVPVSEG